jgi:predicted MFS family arabinose efflux permease
MAVGSIVGGVLYERVSNQLPFYVAMLLVVPSIVLTLLFVKEPEKREQ